MAASRKRKPARPVKNLSAKKLPPAETSRVKGGYIGETEKNRSASTVGSVFLPAVQKSSE